MPTSASLSSGTMARRISASRPNRCCRPPPSAASVGSPMTGQDMVDRAPHPGPDVASAASDVSAIADALGIARFAVMVELDWFAGMGAAGAAELRAAFEGRTALERYLAATEFDPEMFTPADEAALKGAWSWLGKGAGRALEGGIGGVVGDDHAYAPPRGFVPGAIPPPPPPLRGGPPPVPPPSPNPSVPPARPSS